MSTLCPIRPSAAVALAALAVAFSAALPVFARDTNFGGVEAEGRYAVVHPIEDARPNPRISPGKFDPQITQGDIHETICVPGWSASRRPPGSYTEGLKRKQIRQYGYSDLRLRDYEQDHVGPIELAGDPWAPENEWPQPRHVIGGWGAEAKDHLESTLHRLVCRKHDPLPLLEAQRAIASDWIAAYKRYIGPNVVEHKRAGARVP